VKGRAPAYLNYFTRVADADVPSRQRLWSTSSHQLAVAYRQFNLATVGKRAFPVSSLSPHDCDLCTVARDIPTAF